MTLGLLAFIEMMRSRKSSASAKRMNSIALSTMPAGVSPWRFMMRSDNEPWLVPMRSERPSCFARRTSGRKRSATRSTSAAYSASLYSVTAKRFLSA